jgi:hypothetical protein
MNIAKTIYESYPDSDLLEIDPETDLEDLDTLYAKIGPGFGDALFEHIVSEAKEGAEGDVDLTIHLLERSVRDLQSVIAGLENQRVS